MYEKDAKCYTLKSTECGTWEARSGGQGSGWSRISHWDSARESGEGPAAITIFSHTLGHICDISSAWMRRLIVTGKEPPGGISEPELTLALQKKSHDSQLWVESSEDSYLRSGKSSPRTNASLVLLIKS